MVTAAQLQILQSPITHLISTVSTSVNVKLDDSNYLNWNFQIQLLLESNGIFGFVDGSQPCPSPSSAALGEYGSGDPNSSSVIDCDALMIWKIHDRAVMQLITATLSPIALSCAIGSNSSRELWMRLKEQFSTVSKTSIFQLKSNLQNIRKGSDNISQYLLKIKEARDYLMAAGVHFADEDIVILALNGLPSEYNTFRCVVRGRESVIPLKEFHSQLLAEERIVENIVPENSSYLTAMHTISTGNYKPPGSSFRPTRGQSGFNSYDNGSYRSFNRNRGRGRFPSSGQRSFFQRTLVHGKAPAVPNPSPSYSNVTICQLCNSEGHTAPMCGLRNYERFKCSICGKFNHTTWFCYYNENGPNFAGNTASGSSSPQQSQHHALNTMHNVCSSSQHPSASQQVWITDSGATNHMTADLSNLSLTSSYPANDTVQTANGEGQTHTEDLVQRTVQ